MEMRKHERELSGIALSQVLLLWGRDLQRVANICRLDRPSFSNSRDFRAAQVQFLRVHVLVKGAVPLVTPPTLLAIKGAVPLVTPPTLLAEYNFAYRTEYNLLICIPCNHVLGKCIANHAKEKHSVCISARDQQVIKATCFKEESQYLPSDHPLLLPLDFLPTFNGFKSVSCNHYTRVQRRSGDKFYRLQASCSVLFSPAEHCNSRWQQLCCRFG